MNGTVGIYTRLSSSIPEILYLIENEGNGGNDGGHFIEEYLFNESHPTWWLKFQDLQHDICLDWHSNDVEALINFNPTVVEASNDERNTAIESGIDYESSCLNAHSVPDCSQTSLIDTSCSMGDFSQWYFCLADPVTTTEVSTTTELFTTTEHLTTTTTLTANEPFTTSEPLTTTTDIFTTTTEISATSSDDFTTSTDFSTESTLLSTENPTESTKFSTESTEYDYYAGDYESTEYSTESTKNPTESAHFSSTTEFSTEESTEITFIPSFPEDHIQTINEIILVIFQAYGIDEITFVENEYKSRKRRNAQDALDAVSTYGCWCSKPFRVELSTSQHSTSHKYRCCFIQLVFKYRTSVFNQLYSCTQHLQQKIQRYTALFRLIFFNKF